MQNPIKLVIFDMDGLMFDTERINYESWSEVSKTYQFPFEEKIHTSWIGIRDEDCVQQMRTMYGEKSDIDLWRGEVKRIQSEYIEANKTVHQKKGLLELLDYLENKGIKKVVASSSSKEIIKYYLSLENLEHYFDHLISGEEVKHGKPAPDIFLAVCENMKISTENAIVLEDSINGLKAARAANIKNICIPDRIQVSEELIQISDAIRDDLSEVIAYIENGE